MRPREVQGISADEAVRLWEVKQIPWMTAYCKGTPGESNNSTYT